MTDGRPFLGGFRQVIEKAPHRFDGTPEIHPLAGDAYHHLVQMPAIARPWATPAQPSRDCGTELQHPSPHRFVGDVEPSFGQQFLDVSVAQGEAEIKPNRVLDNLGREAVAAVAERSHAAILSDTRLAPEPVSVTMPRQPLQQALHDWRRQRVHPFRPIEGQYGNAVFNRFEQFGQRVHISLHCADLTQPISLRAGL